MAGGYERYLLGDERVVVALHQHWARVAVPVAATVLGLVVAVWVEIVVPPSAELAASVLWWAWFVQVLWLVYHLVQWRHDWFVATDKRLLLTYGLITTKVAMMPLTKVTDLSYGRSLLGRVVGYGGFVLESAGQDQALREVSWIPRPDETYRAICAEIFGSPDDDAPVGHHEPHVEESPGEPSVTVGASYDVRSPVQEHGAWSQALPVRAPEGESLYVSEDLTRRERADDTGPLPRYDD